MRICELLKRDGITLSLEVFPPKTSDKYTQTAAAAKEIEKGRGTQFDPRFADIMLEMIDDDPGYRMQGNTTQVQ